MRKLAILAVVLLSACATSKTAKRPEPSKDVKVLSFPKEQVLDAAADYLTYRSGRDWDVISKDLETGLVRSMHRSSDEARSRVWVQVNAVAKKRTRVTLSLIEERQDPSGLWRPIELPRSIRDRESAAFFSGLEGALKRLPKPGAEPPAAKAPAPVTRPSGSFSNFANIGRSAR